MHIRQLLQTRRRRAFDRQAIEHHYDLSNEFYALFLDPLMVYTCAYYRDPDGDLETAQRDKLDLVCRKLRLGPGDRLLDLGCGWGSLAVWAAKHYGADVTAISLSREQVEFGRAWATREGLADRCRIELLDYRDLPAGSVFDRISAIGLIEHVGKPHYAEFFARVHRHLAPGGLFLNHGITSHRHWIDGPQHAWLRRHVFPNGDLTHVSALTEIMEQQRFEVLDVESLRPHYVRTCRQWVERLVAHEEEAVRLVGERTYRIWRLYLTSSSIGFERGTIGLHQVLTARASSEAERPRTRESIYRPEGAGRLHRAS